MMAALHNSFVDFVIYMGMTEKYPDWFRTEVLDDIYMDSERFTFWVEPEERKVDYYEQTLVEDYSVFLRKQDGSIWCTNYDSFDALYRQFEYDQFNNSGVASFEEDTIEFVECQPGVLSKEYPDWFYEFFTESHHVPNEESIFIFEKDWFSDKGSTHSELSSSVRDFDIIDPLDGNISQVSVDHHCVFLRNGKGEIRHMPYEDFVTYYNPGPVWSYAMMPF